MIDIITYSDNYQKILKNLFFKPSFSLYLKNDFRHIDIIENNTPDNYTEFGFGSPIFQHMIYRRWEILIEHIESCIDRNKVSIFSDIDVVFLGNFRTNIDALLSDTYHNYVNNDHQKDVYFMPETPTELNFDIRNNHNINAGFFVFRHSKETLDFFSFILQFMKNQRVKEDQLYIREYLRKRFMPNIGLLDFSVFNTNNCDFNTNLSLLKANKLKVFHATSCFDLNEKIKILYNITKPIHKQILLQI